MQLLAQPVLLGLNNHDALVMFGCVVVVVVWQLLRRVPSDRLPLLQVLEHPWIVNPDRNPNELLY